MSNILESKKRYREAHRAELRVAKKIYLKERPWYSSYEKAKQRCIDGNNISYRRYGGRGIQFNMTLNDFKELWFRDRAYLMKMPSVDRIDNNGNYVVENCRFIEQSENTRISHSMKISQYSKDWKYIKTFPSMINAEISTGVHHSDISRCKAKKINLAGGYRWI